MIVLLSNNTHFDNYYLNYEIKEAKRKGVDIYVIKIDNVSLDTTLRSLRTYNIKDYIN